MSVNILYKIDPSHDKYSDSCYKIQYGNKNLYWPLKNGKGLGTCGIWNFLWRLGFHPETRFAGNLPALTNGDVLFVQADSMFDEPTLEFLKGWLNRGGRIVGVGSALAWENIFGKYVQLKESENENPHAALAYIFHGEGPQLIAPQKWTFAVCETNNKELQLMGKLAAVCGERQTPSRALVTPIHNAPAVIIKGRFLYLNGNPFAGFQAWLQGQEDLNPWLAWRHRLFWLDEWVAFMGRLMFDIGMLSRDMTRPGIKGLGRTTVVLKHDLDHSTDTSYLEEETNRGFAGTYSILKDKNASFWKDYLRRNQQHEAAFHYNTAKRNWFDEGKRMILGKPHGVYVPAIEQISGDGLLKQVRWAKNKGIGIKTLHRHFQFLVYPEWIDAMDRVFDFEPEVLGSNSLFRGAVLRWGIDCVEGNLGFVGQWPDAQFPLWFPFKLGHAGLGGKMLRGWESSSIIEPEPELFIQMLDYEIKELPQRIIILNFHPAHASKPTFYRDGSLESYIKIIEVIKERSIPVVPLYRVYQLADDSIA